MNDTNATEGQPQVSFVEQGFASQPLNPMGPQVSRLARRRQFLCSLLRVVGVVALGIVVLTATRQSRTPAPLYSEIIAESGEPAAPRREVNWREQYAWLSKPARKSYAPLLDRLPEPTGYTRVKVSPGSFAEWLRYLPVSPEGTPVKTGKAQVVLGADSPRLAAVVALQPSGDKILDAVNMALRLRAEYLWSANKPEQAVFHFTSGHLAKWSDWASGVRPVVNGRQVEFRQSQPADSGRSNYCCFLETVFRYATVYSVYKDTRAADDQAVEAGDVFLRLGKVGHAVMVLDVAANPEGRVMVLLGQGGKPAQAFHVLRDRTGSPWFPLTQTQPIDLGDKGLFKLKDLRHWGN